MNLLIPATIVLFSFLSASAQAYLVIGMNDCTNCQVGFSKILSLDLRHKPLIVHDKRVPQQIVREFVDLQGLTEKKGWQFAQNMESDSMQNLLVSDCKGNYILVNDKTEKVCFDLGALTNFQMLKIKAFDIGAIEPKEVPIKVSQKPNFSRQLLLMTGPGNHIHIFDYQFSRIVSLELNRQLQPISAPKIVSANSLDGISFCARLPLNAENIRAYDSSYSFLKANKKDHPFFRTFVWHQNELWIQGEFPMLSKMTLRGKQAKEFGKTVNAIRPEFYVGKCDLGWNPSSPILIMSPKPKHLDIDQNLPCLLDRNGGWIVPVFNDKTYGPMFARYSLDPEKRQLAFVSLLKNEMPSQIPDRLKDYRFLTYFSPAAGLAVFKHIPAFFQADQPTLIPFPGLIEQTEIKETGPNGDFKSNFKCIAAATRGDFIEVVYSLNGQTYWGVLSLLESNQWVRLEVLPNTLNLPNDAALLDWGELIYVNEKRELQATRLFSSGS